MSNSKMTFTNYELVDMDKLECLLHSMQLRRWDKAQLGIEDILKRHPVMPNLEKFSNCIVDNKIKITYTLDKFGRYKNTNDLDVGFSYSNMFGIIRNLLTKKYYYDIDIVNCHPVIIYNICLRHNINCDRLKEFIENREEILKYIVDNNEEGKWNEERIDLANDNSMNREIAKRFCLMFFFGASLKKKMNEFNIDDVDVEINGITNWFMKFYDELTKIINSINKLDCYKEIVIYVIDKKNDNVENLRGSIFSHIIQNEERILFDILSDNLIKKGYEVGAYIYDGCHIRNNKQMKLPKLKLFSNILTDSFNLENAMPIKLIIKDMEINESFLETDCDFKTYKLLKYNLENNDKVYKVLSPVSFHNGLIDSSKEIPLMTKKEFLDKYENIGYTNSLGKFIPVANAYIKDKFIKTYKKIIFDPNPDSKESNDASYLNKFEGFEINKHTYKDIPETIEELKEESNIIFEFIEKLCNNDEHNIKFILNYIITVLKTPYIKTGAMPLFKGKAGRGKTTLYLLLRAIIGDRYCIQTTSLDNTIFGKHAIGRKDKLLILLDEVKYESSKNHTENLKTAITSDTMYVEPKNINGFEYNSYENYIACSNNEIPVELDNNNRRVLVVDCDVSNFGNDDEKRTFFDEFYKIIGTRHLKPNYRILKCFYEYCIKSNIGEYRFEDNVKTATTLEISKKCSVNEFLSQYLFTLYKKDNYFYNEKEHILSSNSLYDLFKKYCERVRLEAMSNIRFGIKINKYDFITRSRGRNGNFYIFDVKKYCENYDYNTEGNIEVIEI